MRVSTDQVLRRSRPLTGHGTPAPAAAGAASPQTADDDAEAKDSPDAVDTHAPDADGNLADSDELSPPAGRYALYNAFEEAEHW
ncbi:hypothetical protein OG604_49290 [Streptomyces sp. NBC_01231]|nr:hypothetical protein OG604_49290 [Streptomyces sp. NBC_01231]